MAKRAPYKVSKADELDLTDPIDTVVAGYVGDLENSPEANTAVKDVMAGIDWASLHLTERQRRFIEFYTADPTNATRAALNAGYSPACAAIEGSLALRHPKLSAVIAKIMNARIERTQLTVDKILHELEVLMTASIADFETEGSTVRVREGRPEYLIKAVKSVTFTTVKEVDGTTRAYVTIQLYNKETILRMAGQYHKMFVESSEVNHKGSVGMTHTWNVAGKEITF